MSNDKTAEIFFEMGFDEVMDEDIALYILEDDEGYLLVSDEYGHTPALDEMIIVAYYSLDDAFLWKAEFKDVKDIYEFFKACKSEKDFLILLKEKAEEESFN